MKKIIQKILSMGADFSTRKALKTTLGFVGMKPENIDKLYAELKNDYYKEQFKDIPSKEKIVFLPHCLRKYGCDAKVERNIGYKCNGCKNHKSCKVYAIKNEAEKKGYRVFVTPGGSMVMDIVKKMKPKAVIGVACMKEIVIALDNLNVPLQSITLSRDGCVGTDVKIKEVFDVL